MNKIAKIILLFISCALISIFVLENIVQADNFDWSGLGTQIESATPANDTTTNIEKAVQTIIKGVRVIAMGVAITMLTVLAIKYISAAPGDKADIKKHAVVYVVGAVILFGVSGILTIIGNFAENVK